MRPTRVLTNDGGTVFAHAPYRSVVNAVEAAHRRGYPKVHLGSHGHEVPLDRIVAIEPPREPE